MKKLTVRPRLGKGNIKLIERELGYQLPNDFRNFITENAGLSHYECLFSDSSGDTWEVSQYNQYKDLIGLLREFKGKGRGLKISFAFDPGGWHYCLSFDKDTFGKIMVNRWTDHEEKDQFLIIAESFEEFINGLKRKPSL
ncbi:MAG: SMI1/KNR4 family protein [Bacteroidota bacterium]